MPIRAITFDFWFTLFREANGQPRQRTRAVALSEATGIPIDEAESALHEVAREFRIYHLTHEKTLGPIDAVHMIARRFNITLDEKLTNHLATAFAEAVLPYPPEPIEGSLEAVQLAAQVMPVGIISDTGMSPGRYLRKLLDRFGFSPHVTCSVFSDEIGVSKPQTLAFEECAKKLQVLPSELLHIGDTEETDIVGAKRVGAVSVLFTGGGTTPNSLHTSADYVLTSWKEFAELLHKLLSENKSS